MSGNRREAEKQLTKSSRSPFDTKSGEDDLTQYDGAKDKIGL